MLDQNTKYKFTHTPHNMNQQHTFTTPTISKLTPFLIPKYQVHFVHDTLINYHLPNHNPIYTSSFPPNHLIHNLIKTNHPSMVEQTIKTTETPNPTTITRKPRILCLHGFRTSGKIFETQLKKWPESVLDKIDFVFPDAPFPCNGKSEVEGIFDPPYYEWFQFNKEFTEYENFEKCLEYIEECMIKHAPVDGLAGFSQGAILAAALPGLQARGLALTRVQKIKFIMIVSGAKLRNEAWAEKAYSVPIQCPSLHFLGDADFLKPYGTELLKLVEDPLVIRHPKGHTIPRLDEEGLKTLFKFIDRIQEIVSNQEKIVSNQEDVVTI